MPHCIIEYSRDLGPEMAPSNLLSAVYFGALESELFSEGDIKVRALPFDHFAIGHARQNFVHVNVKILSGRSLEERKELTQLILAKLRDLFTNPISLTVEVTEIETESYAKSVNE